MITQPGATPDGRPAHPPPSVAGIRALAELCQSAGVQELQASDGEWSIRLALAPYDPAAGPSPTAPPAAETDPAGPWLLRSEWVGVFHRTPDGHTEPFAREGDAVRRDQVLGLVAALQLQHELRADRDGILVRFLVEDDTPIEYGQPMVEID